MLEKLQRFTRNESPSVLVLIKSNGAAQLVEPPVAGITSIEGEDFMVDPSVPDWIGFYDWLRTSNGELIGVRLQPDEGTLNEATLNFLVALDKQNSVYDIFIFFSAKREFDPVVSGDGDFGGNALLRGTTGSLALAFNAPT